MIKEKSSILYLLKLKLRFFLNFVLGYIYKNSKIAIIFLKKSFKLS